VSTKNDFDIVQIKYRGEFKIPKNWELKKIGESMKFEYGKALVEEDRTNEGFPVYGSGGIVGKHDKFFKQGPGIIIARKGSLGKVHFTNEHFWPIDTVYYITEKETKNDLRFLFYLLKFLKLENYAIVTAQPGISRDEIYTIYLKLPSIPEQKKIGHILTNIDLVINQTDEYKEKIKKLKKGLTQKLLREGINNKKFENNKLSKLPQSKYFKIVQGWNISPLKKIVKINPENITKDYPHKKIKYLDIGNIEDFKIEKFEEFEINSRPSRAQRIIKKGDILVSTVRPYLKGFTKVESDEKNLVCSTGFAVLRPKIQTDTELIFNYIQSQYFETEVIRKMEGMAYPAISGTIVGECLIPLSTDEKERKDIGIILNNFEEKIRMLEKRINLLEKIKKSFMQKLLTGEIRVKE
jgi:type I restriction enzyme, S subunit